MTPLAGAPPGVRGWHGAGRRATIADTGREPIPTTPSARPSPSAWTVLRSGRSRPDRRPAASEEIVTYPDHVPVIACGLGVLALVVMGATIRWPGPTLVSVLAILPFHRLVVAALDHSVLPPPPSTDPFAPAYHFEQYFFVRLLALDATLLGGLLAGTAFRAARGTLRPRRPPALVGAALAYVGLVGSLAIVSPIPLPALLGLVLDASGPVLLITIWGLAPDRRIARAGAIALVASCGLFLVGAVIEQHLTATVRTWVEYTRPGPPFFTGGRPGYRSGALLGGPLEYAFFSAAALPIGIGLLRTTRPRWRLLAVLGVAVVAAGLALTFTRSGYLGAAVGLALVTILTSRRRLHLVGTTALGTAAVAVVLLVSIAGVGPLAHGDSNAAHLSRVRTDIDLIRANPGGYGLGTIDIVAYVLGLHGLPLNASEDIYLGKGVEGGIALMTASGVLLTLLVGTMALRSRRALRRGDREAAALCAGAAGACLAAAVAGLFLAIQETAIVVATWGMAGLALSASETPVAARGLATDCWRPTARVLPFPQEAARAEAAARVASSNRRFRG